MWVTTCTPEPVGRLEGEESDWQSGLGIWDGAWRGLVFDLCINIEDSYRHLSEA